MDRTTKRMYQLLVLAGVGVLLFMLAFSRPFLIDTTDCSIYNGHWNGCSDIAIRAYESGNLQPSFYIDQNELTLNQRSFSEFSIPPKNSTIIIIAPQTAFTEQEGSYMRQFLLNGGKLLLADDFGTGNDLLAKLNTTYRFSGRLLLDLSYEKRPSFVTIFTFVNSTHPFLQNVSRLLLNYPTYLTPENGTRALAFSSELSWIDHNQDGIHNQYERSGPFPILAIEPYGEGEVILLSDPSVFINSMNHQLNNSQFRSNLFSSLFDERTIVLIDESHREFPVPLRIVYDFPTTLSLELKISILLLAIFAFVVGFTKLPHLITQKGMTLLFRRKKPSERESADTLIEKVLQQHPTWSRKKLQDIILRLK